jgi:hypothetical protein
LDQVDEASIVRQQGGLPVFGLADDRCRNGKGAKERFIACRRERGRGYRRGYVDPARWGLSPGTLFCSRHHRRL